MKRLLDLIASILLIILTSPLFVLIYIVVFIFVGRPVIFKQQRPGLNGVPFYLYKFRTMTNETDTSGLLLPDEKRLTPIGILLRKLSLDEFPQLFNVLKGDMSFVGPRPLLMKYFPFYTEREQKRHTVRPGITGLAQVSGRNQLSWDQRLELDVLYVESRNLWLDFIILFRTIIKVIKRDGVVDAPGTIMMNLDEERKLRL